MNTLPFTLNATPVETGKIERAQTFFRAFNHPLRQQILSVIDKQPEITVTEIYCRLHLEQSVASQHLAILRKANIVKNRRDGKFIGYCVNYDMINLMQDVSEKLISTRFDLKKG